MTIAIRFSRPEHTLYLMRKRDVVAAYAWGVVIGAASVLLWQALA